MIFLFWVSIIFIGFTYAGYPLVIAIWSQIRPRPVKKNDYLPSVSILIAAHNEEKVIEEKIKNCLSLQYPPDRYEIFIASDGSTDKTNAIVRGFSDPRVRLAAYDENEGKTKTLIKSIPALTGEIVVFTDASEMFEPGSVSEIVGNFSDPEVGCVSGELYFYDPALPTSLSRGVGLYWAYEKILRRAEARVDSMMGATGAFYAMRKSLFAPPPEHLILDDIAIPFGCILAGYRAVFDPKAKIYERISESFDEEFYRKVRTQAGVYELMADMPDLLNPSKNRVWIQFLCHKVFRLFVPYFLVALFIANSFIVGAGYRIFLGLQAVFYGLALLGWLFVKRNIHSRLTSFPYSFCVLNLAAFVSPVYFVRRRKQGAWTRTKI